MAGQTQQGGYRVQKGGMAAEADKLDRAGDDAGDIGAALQEQLCYTPDALGGSDSGPAFNNFSAAWQAEAKVLESALHELADKVRISKANYHGADIQAMNDLQAGGGGLTTMPAPAPAGSVPGIGMRTMPAPGPPPPGSPPVGLADFG
ncbi:type VII secretion target [Streptomyces flavidovirens]|uniref:Type VII secretion target n=1 Tax=Streptomyces flavidovirens TaxID=67298 RepID=A0ABW6RP76_9ACTN